LPSIYSAFRLWEKGDESIIRKTDVKNKMNKTIKNIIGIAGIIAGIIVGGERVRTPTPTQSRLNLFLQKLFVFRRSEAVVFPISPIHRRVVTEGGTISVPCRKKTGKPTPSSLISKRTVCEDKTSKRAGTTFLRDITLLRRVCPRVQIVGYTNQFFITVKRGILRKRENALRSRIKGSERCLGLTFK
jgi:hypothetical protein